MNLPKSKLSERTTTQVGINSDVTANFEETDKDEMAGKLKAQQDREEAINIHNIEQNHLEQSALEEQNRHTENAKFLKKAFEDIEKKYTDENGNHEYYYIELPE